MAKLILSINGVERCEYRLNKERVTIGRKPGNDIRIDNLAVSRKHALAITILNDSFLEDLGTTNGTYVNGKLIKKHVLKNGDRIVIGKHELKYIEEFEGAADNEFARRLVIKPGSASTAVAAAHKAERAIPVGIDPAATTAPPLGRLTALDGPFAGQALALGKALIMLGKPGVQVVLISRRPWGYFLIHVEADGDGKHSPAVNGEAVGREARQLKDDDLIELAGIKMKFTEVRERENPD